MCSRCSDVGKGDVAPKSSKLKGDLPTATTTTTATTIATTTAGAQPWKLTKDPCTVYAYGCSFSNLGWEQREVQSFDPFDPGSLSTQDAQLMSYRSYRSYPKIERMQLMGLS